MNKFITNLIYGLVVIMALSVAAPAHADENGEANSAVGPDKGITEANSKDGFKLSPEAIKKLDIKTVPFAGQSMFKLAKSGIFFGLQENNIFRVRSGFFKRIDFKSISKAALEWTVSSPELRTGDQIVISGVGHLRIVELQATGGIADEH